eukprot:477054_1
MAPVIFTAFCIINTVFSTPSCQYGLMIPQQIPVEWPLGYCDVHVQPHDFSGSSMYSCNDTNNGIDAIFWANLHCNGFHLIKSDETRQFKNFDCALPKCDNSNPLLSWQESPDCQDYNTIYHNATLITNDCIAINDTESVMITCNNNPPSFTITEYHWSAECQSNDVSYVTYQNGCNFVGTPIETYINVDICTVPTQISTQKSTNMQFKEAQRLMRVFMKHAIH